MGGEEDNPNDLPYRSEYAKSGRAKCKGCKVEIPKGDLRLASMTQVFKSAEKWTSFFIAPQSFSGGGLVFKRKLVTMERV